MNASVQRMRRTMPILRRPDDRWLGSNAPDRRMSALMMVVLVISLAIHAGLIATALLADRPGPIQAATEVSVEIVREVPPAPQPETPMLRKAVDPAPAPPPAELRKADPAPPPAEPPKPETPKPGPLTPEPLTPEQRTADTPRAEPAKPEPATEDSARREANPTAAPRPAVTTAANPGQTSPAPTETAQPKAADPKPAASADTLETLERELAALRTERAALAAERNVATATEVGPHSFEAIALPATSDTGEATGYESLVFSQLYKAKEAHRHQGLPGTATVVFTVDDAGKLVQSAVAAPSGVASLDAEALQVIREAAPFPPPPAGAQHEFSANVSFVVGDHY